MKDKEYKEQKKRVEKYLNKWAKPIGMGWHKLDIEFSREISVDIPDALAVTNCLWEYRKALITFYLPIIAETNDDDLEHNVVHELSHVLSWPIWAQLDQSNNETKQIGEYATESIANALIWAREAGKEDK